MNLALEESLSVNHSQFNYDLIGQTIDAISGTDEPRLRNPSLSRARLNRTQKIALEMRSMLTEIKPTWEYRANCKRYEKQADIFSKLARNWYMTRGVDQVFKDAVDYMLAAGSAYVHLFWNPELPGPPDKRGQPTIGDIDCRAEDPRDVLPIRPSGDRRSTNSARGWIIRRERPTSWYRQIYGSRADGVVMDRMGMEKESPSARHHRGMQERVMEESKGYFHDALFGGEPASKLPGGMPITDEFTAYLHDRQVNKSGKPKEMGPWTDAVDGQGNETRVPGSFWSYIAQPNELLYPFGRRIVFTRYGILEDGPSHFHFGRIPLCKLTLDSWAWSMVGTSPIHGILPLQRAVDETIRMVQDHIRRAARRGVVYDKNAVSSTAAKKMDTRKDGLKLAVNPHAAGPKGAIQFIDEPELSRSIPEWLQFLLESMDEESGISALKQFAQLAQVPSTETIDKIIDSMTPLVRARSRSMELFMRDFAMMLASMFMQYYTLDLRLRILGADGMTYEDWDYASGDMVPDYIADEYYENPADAASLKPQIDRQPSPDHIRNIEFLRYFDYEIVPGSLLDAATTTKKMLYIQLARMGLVDHWTLLEVLQVPNVGQPPDWATDITSRLQAEQMMGLGLMASTVGRPPTAQTMPHMTSTGAMAES